MIISNQRAGWTYTVIPGDMSKPDKVAQQARSASAGLRLLPSSAPERCGGPEGTEIWGKGPKKVKANKPKTKKRGEAKNG